MKLLFGVLALAVSLSGGARADVISYSDSYAPVAAGGWSHAFALSRFDSSLGSLNAVTFNYGLGVTGRFRLENLEAKPVTFLTQAGGNVVFYGPVSRSIAASASASQAVGAFDGQVDYSGASGVQIGPLSATNAGALGVWSGWADLIGSGVFAIDAQAFSAPSARGDGQLSAEIISEMTGWISVSYDYTPAVRQVPEPLSMALVGIGVLGLGVLRRRPRVRRA